MKNLDLLKQLRQKEESETIKSGDDVVEIVNHSGSPLIKVSNLPKDGWNKQILYKYPFEFEYRYSGNACDFSFSREGLSITQDNKSSFLIPFNQAFCVVETMLRHFEQSKEVQSGFGVAKKNTRDFRANEMVESSEPNKDVVFYSNDNRMQPEEICYFDREQKLGLFFVGSGIRFINKGATPEVEERFRIVLTAWHFEGFMKFWEKCKEVYEVEELNRKMWIKHDSTRAPHMYYKDKKPRIFFAGNKLSKIVKESRG